MKTASLQDIEILIATGRATAADLEALDYRDVVTLKSRDDNLQARGITFRRRDLVDGGALVKAALEDEKAEGSRLITYVASTEDQDRMGDIIRVFGREGGEGWQLAHFEANPVFLWSHESWNPPIGSVVRVFKDTIVQGGVEKPVLLAVVDYMPKDENPFAETVFKMAKAGRLEGVSVGFLPDPKHVIEYGSVREREEAGLGPRGVEFTQQELLELSQAVVPANPFALQTGMKDLVSAGLITAREARAFEKVYPMTMDDLVGRVRERIRSVVDFGRSKAPADLTGGESPHGWPDSAEGDRVYEALAGRVDKGLVDSLERSDEGEEEKAKRPVGGKVHRAHSPVPNRPSTLRRDLGNIEVRSFDVDDQHLEAAKLEHDWVSRFCSCEVRHLHELVDGVDDLYAGSFLTGLKEALAEFEETSVRNITDGSRRSEPAGREIPPVYEHIQLTAEKSDDFLVGGLSFRKGQGKALVVKTTETWGGYRVGIWTEKSNVGAAHDILEKAWGWVARNNFLKGQAFALTGGFIAPTKETWDDIFLDGDIKKTVQRAVENTNAKGADCPNRGMIWMGPPGTGKTLTGRVMRNAIDATLVWVSARDLMRTGGCHGFLRAFQVARDLAPAVVFLEDVDNWFYGAALDLLKTEMDGLARSSGILTVLTTNHPERIPEALIDRPGRFHDVKLFGLPSAEVRTAMIERWAPEVTGDALKSAVKGTNGMSGAHVYELCAYAATIAEQDDVDKSAAMALALDKLKEQRDKIGEQLSVSQIRGLYAPTLDNGLVSSQARGDDEGRAAEMDQPQPDTQTRTLESADQAGAAALSRETEEKPGPHGEDEDKPKKPKKDGGELDAEARATLGSALSSAFDLLGDAQELVGRALDVVEARADDDEGEEASLDSGGVKAIADQGEIAGLLRDVRDILKSTQTGGPGGDPSPSAGRPSAALERGVNDPTPTETVINASEAAELVADVRSSLPT